VLHKKFIFKADKIQSFSFHDLKADRFLKMYCLFNVFTKIGLQEVL